MTNIAPRLLTAARCAICVLALCALSVPSLAESYDEATQKACNHMRNCMKDRLGEVPSEYQAMIEQSLEGMCDAMPKADEISGFGPQHRIYQPAVACMQSIAALSCDQIEAGASDTTECQQLESMYGN